MTGEVAANDRDYAKAAKGEVELSAPNEDRLERPSVGRPVARFLVVLAAQHGIERLDSSAKPGSDATVVREYRKARPPR